MNGDIFYTPAVVEKLQGSCNGLKAFFQMFKWLCEHLCVNVMLIFVAEVMLVFVCLFML